MPTHLTTALFWKSAAVVAIVDGALLALLLRTAPRARFARFGGGVTLVSAIWFGLLWTAVLNWGWDWFYRYLFPPWMRALGPLLFTAAYGLTGLGLWWLAARLPGRPALTFALLGSIEGLLTHLWAIYGLGALTEPPSMAGVQAPAVLAFATVEKLYYWSCILLITAVAHRRLQPTR